MSEPKQLDLRKVGLDQRLAMWGFLIIVVINVLYYKFGDHIIIQLAGILSLLFLLYCVFRLARSLKLHIVVSIIYVILIPIPLIGILALLILIRKASKVLREAGIRVGVMGANVADLPKTNDTSA